MIAAANPHAARAGLEMLRAGGGAVDATIAAQLVLTLVEPQSSGIGGGAFLLHYAAAAREVAAYDGRETAPAAVTPKLFLRTDGKPMRFREAVIGGRSVGVPGVLRMLETAHRDHGRLPWKRLFDPAIRLADEGFFVSPRLNKMIRRAKGLDAIPATRRYFLTADGRPLPVGTRLRNPAYAETLRRIADGGADAFYTGEIAADIVAAVRNAPRNPGLLAMPDLAGYRAKTRAPLCRPYREVRICGMPPPTSGGVAVLQILGLLEGFDMGALGPGSADAVHLFTQASRLAYADRRVYLADSDFVDVPVAGLLDSGYLAARRKLIDPSRDMGKAIAGRPPGATARLPGEALELVSTSHLSVVDADGNAVSMTTSIESAFGSRVMVRGFLLNNQLTDFSFRPVIDGRPVANRVQPGKRPRSSMSPTLVLDPDITSDPLPGSGGPSRILMTPAWLDKQVSNQCSEVMARTLGIPNLSDGSLVSGLQQIPDAAGPQDSAMVMYDSGSFDLFDPAHAPFIPPLANLIPSSACDPHGARPRIPAGVEQLVTFLKPGGQVVNFCNGICDAGDPTETRDGDPPCDPTP